MPIRKEILYPIFLECYNHSDDIYWQNIFEDLSYGISPYGTYFSKDYLCCNYKKKEFSYKIKAFKKYTSEIQKYPSPRSLENLENWANVRGMESNTKKAESFKIIKTIST